MTWEDEIRSIYFNPDEPASFMGADKLRSALLDRGFTVSLYKINRWLASEDSYSLFKQRQKHFKTDKVYVTGINEQWDIDLLDMTSLEKYNDGYRYILITIDVFTRIAHAVALKNKLGQTTANGLDSILSSTAVPANVRSDSGAEFKNRKVLTLLKNYNINHFVSLNIPYKAGYVERFGRTLKSKIYRYLNSKNTSRYIDHLADFVSSYNNTVHSALQMKPSEVNSKNASWVWWFTYWFKDLKSDKPSSTKNVVKKKSRRVYGFKPEDLVRVSAIKNPFAKESTTAWSNELFVVKRRRVKDSIVTYKISDYDSSEMIDGWFYPQELQKVFKDTEAMFAIEKIIKRRRLRDGTPQVFVKWRDYSKRFNSWIDEGEINKL